MQAVGWKQPGRLAAHLTQLGPAGRSDRRDKLPGHPGALCTADHLAIDVDLALAQLITRNDLAERDRHCPRERLVERGHPRIRDRDRGVAFGLVDPDVLGASQRGGEQHDANCYASCYDHPHAGILALGQSRLELVNEASIRDR